MIFSVFQKNMVFGYSWPTLLWYWCYYPHRSRDALSPVCGIFPVYQATVINVYQAKLFMSLWPGCSCLSGKVIYEYQARLFMSIVQGYSCLSGKIIHVYHARAFRSIRQGYSCLSGKKFHGYQARLFT